MPGGTGSAAPLFVAHPGSMRGPGMRSEEAEAAPLELWGGVESALVRVGDSFRDQSAETGHDLRPGDIDPIADLGTRTVRYSIRRKRVAPDRPDRLDFGWASAGFCLGRSTGRSNPGWRTWPSS